MGPFLNLISPKCVLVIDNSIMCRFHWALKACMRLKVEVKVETVDTHPSHKSRQMNKETSEYETRWPEEDDAYTAVTPLSTTVPGLVFPFLSANWESVGKNLVFEAVIISSCSTILVAVAQICDYLAWCRFLTKSQKLVKYHQEFKMNILLTRKLR